MRARHRHHIEFIMFGTSARSLRKRTRGTASAEPEDVGKATSGDEVERAKEMNVIEPWLDEMWHELSAKVSSWRVGADV
jgi:hypothetical protein